MSKLQAIGRRELRRRKARYALTALGIVLGVANIFGVLVTNASTNRTIRRQSEVFRISQVFAEPRGKQFDAPTIDRLRRVPDVRAVVVFGDAIELKVGRRERPFYFGAYDRVARVKYRNDGITRGRLFRVGTNDVVLTKYAARELRRQVGDDLVLPVRAPKGVQRVSFRVTGILGTKAEFGGEVSLDYIWKVRGERTAAELGFTLKRGVSPASWSSERQAEFPDVRFNSTAYPADFTRFISILQGAMSGAAAIAVFVGAFLIYLTFSMAVVERTRMYGTLHAVGATAGQIARAVLREALLLGGGASLAGLLVGTLLSFGLLRLVSRAVNVPYAGLAISPSSAVVSVAVGMFATLVGSFAPALRAARVSPVEAIRGSLTAVAKPTRTWIAGAVLVAGAIGMSLALRGIQAPDFISQLSTLALLLGAVLLVPPLLGLLVRAGRNVIRRLTGGLGDVAVMHLARERSRSAYTLGLVMVVLAMMLALAATSGSVGRSVTTWVDKRFGADLLAYNRGVTKRAEDAVANVRGVAAVTAVTFGQTQVLDGRRRVTPNLVLIDPEKFFAIAGFPWAAGSDAEARAALSNGGGILIPGTLAEQLSIKRGEAVRLVTRAGPRPFRVEGIYASIAAGNEVGIVAGIVDARQFFVGNAANVLYINLERGSRHRIVTDIDRALVRAGAASEYEPVSGPYKTKLRSSYFFVPGAEIKAQARRNVRSYFMLFYAVLFVAVIVGLLGLANTMTTSVIQRFREFGVLGAVGASPEDIRRMVISEAAMLVGVAFLLALALGTLLARLLVGGVERLVGFPMSFIFPWIWVPILAVGSALIALAAAVLPARRASRLTPVEALRYE